MKPMAFIRCLAFSLSLLALQVPARAQLPSPAAPVVYLGRTPDSGLTSTLLVGINRYAPKADRAHCHETVVRHVARYGDENRIQCDLIGRYFDFLSLEAGANVWALHDDAPGKYWLSAAVDVSLIVHSLFPDPMGEVLSAFSGHGTAWAADGIMFQAIEDVRVIVEQDPAVSPDPDETVSFWLERCDANGCTVLRELKEKLPWIITLPANQLPAQPSVNPDPNASEHYRISTSANVSVDGREPHFLRDGDSVSDSAEVHLSVSIRSASCIPDTAGC